MATRTSINYPVEAPAAATCTAHVAALNDTLHQTFSGGRVMISAGVSALTETTRAAVLAAVQGFNAFDPDNDPHDEHDFGALAVGDLRCFWKIDAYDLNLRGHSPDPADPTVTTRVLTIMLAGDW